MTLLSGLAGAMIAATWALVLMDPINPPVFRLMMAALGVIAAGIGAAWVSRHPDPPTMTEAIRAAEDDACRDRQRTQNRVMDQARRALRRRVGRTLADRAHMWFNEDRYWVIIVVDDWTLRYNVKRDAWAVWVSGTGKWVTFHSFEDLVPYAPPKGQSHPPSL